MKSKYFFYLFIVIFWCTLILKVFSASMGINATNTPFLHRYIVSIFIPEGWGFFTRNPREVQHTMEKVENNQIQIITIKNTHFTNLFGISRKSRRINLEFQRILAKIPNTSWDNNNTIIRLSGFENQLIYIGKGKYLVKKFTPIPWAWAKYPENFTQKIDTLNIIIE